MEFTIGTLLLGAIVIPILYLIHCYTFWKRQGIPCATGLIPLVGNIFRVILFKSSFSCFCLKVYKENKNCSMVGFYKLTKPVLLIRDPELVKMVLLNHFASFHDNSASVDPHLDPLMAKSPFFTYGDVWMTGRRRLMYALSGKNLKVLFEGVSSVCGKFDNFLERKLQANANEFELKNLFSKFTAEVVANAALGIEGFCFEDESRASSFDSIGKSFLQPSFKNGIIQAFIFFMPQLKGILKIKFIPTDVDAFFRVLVKELLKNRRNGTASRNDFFQLMMEMEKTSEAENLDEELLTSYCLSFFVEGFETSSITLSFVSYQLAIHKVIQEKVREEIMSVMSKYNGAITYEGLKEMTYMEQVINESQRCYPALGVMAKNCTAEFELQGPDGLHCKVKPGMEIVISVCGLHTDSKYWPDPETFDPERFNDERKKDIQKLTFIPFGDGPRICVGMRLAMLQMKACLAALLSKYAIELSPKTQLPIRLSPRHFLLTPVGGFWVYIKKIPSGFLQQPLPYSNMSEVRKYAVARWDPTYKNCLSIVLPDGSLLLQASNAYTRDQWYHSILWKKSIFKYQHLVSVNTREEVILRELRSMVDFALWTPLQDERVAGAPLEAVAKLLEDPSMEEQEGRNKKSVDEVFQYCSDRRSWAEAVLSVAAPLLEKAALPAGLAKALAKLAQQHPQSPLVTALSPAITRCLKHTVDFGKSPDMRKLLQVFVAALYENNDGEQAIRDYIASVHGPGSDCPHPRILPNLVSICVAAIFHRFEVANRILPDENERPLLPPLQCYLLVLNVASEYTDWRPGLGALLQPVPFPEEALAVKEVQESILMFVMKRLAKDPRCTVHRVLLPVRELRPGWIHIAAPSSPACPDQGELFGEMLTTLLACCCRRKRFIGSLMKQAGDDCILLAVRGCDAAQEVLCLMLEWRLLSNEEARLQIVNALESTSSGKSRYLALCQRQRNLQELQQKGGPRKLTLPVRATDADVALLLGGRALGNLECLSLAFTSVTSACAEQLIKLPALRYLNLWATQFGDAGLQMISEHLQKLQVLNLCETPVSDKGISTLASLTSLRKLNLNSTKLSAQTFESLKKRLPALQEFDVRYTEAW